MNIDGRHFIPLNVIDFEKGDKPETAVPAKSAKKG